MAGCLTCAHWDAKRTPPEIRRARLATCALGPRWEYRPPEATCERYKPAPADVTAARLKWQARS